MLSSYEKVQKLGEGTYGAVFRAIHRETKETVALKLVRMDQEDDGIPGNSLREISILQSVEHPNIIAMREVICEEGHINLVFEFMDRDLRNYLERMKAKPISPGLIQSYSFQLLCGIYYLHKNRILHRDIRPGNLLIDRSGFLKIGDFGSARICHRPFYSYEGNDTLMSYNSPELLFSDYPVDFAIDLWSAGCTIAEMIRKCPLFNGDSQIDQLNQIIKIIGMPNEESWPEFKSHLSVDIVPQANSPPFASYFPDDVDPNLLDLLSKLLTLNPRQRITAEEAVHHKFFDTVPQGLIDICL